METWIEEKGWRKIEEKKLPKKYIWENGQEKEGKRRAMRACKWELKKKEK